MYCRYRIVELVKILPSPRDVHCISIPSDKEYNTYIVPAPRRRGSTPSNLSSESIGAFWILIEDDPGWRAFPRYGKGAEAAGAEQGYVSRVVVFVVVHPQRVSGWHQSLHPPPTVCTCGQKSSLCPSHVVSPGPSSLYSLDVTTVILFICHIRNFFLYIFNACRLQCHRVQIFQQNVPVTKGLETWYRM